MVQHEDEALGRKPARCGRMSAYGLIGASIASVIAQALLGGCAKSERSEKASATPALAASSMPAEAPAPQATAQVAPYALEEDKVDGDARVASRVPDAKKAKKDAPGAPPPAAKMPAFTANAESAKESGAVEKTRPRPSGPLRLDEGRGGVGFGVMGGSGKGQGPGGAVVSPTDPSKAAMDDQRAKLAAQTTIDPNGRFATTYRPGAGHLAAFDSAIARGIVTEEERELVSDLGARYSPDFAIPPQKTLWAQNELERAKLPPAGGPVHLRVALKSADVAPAARPHLSVHLVLDVSGSMQGDSIDNARKAAAALVDKLAPSDDFSLVTFSNEAQVLVPDGPVGARRGSIKTTIAGIKEGGGTNIGDGLMLGYKEAAKPSIPADAVKVVLLLSDGRANAGILDQTRLSTLALNAFQDGVQTSTFGLGGDFDGALMSSIANDGAGGYYYLRDAQQIAPALATELDKRLDPVATALEVRIRLKPGVQLLDVYGSRRLSESEEVRVRVQEIAADVQAEKKGIKRDRQDDQKGGMRFFLPGFARNDSHAILLKLNVPEGVGDRDVALVELKYKDRVKKTNVQEELVVKTSFAKSDADSAASINGSVARSVQGFAAGETLAQSARLISTGSRDSAVALLTEREGILRKMAETMNEPLFLKDAERVARLRTHAGVTSGVGPSDPLVLAMLLETASNAHRR